MSKFQIGDKVRVTKDMAYSAIVRAGDTGKVLEVLESYGTDINRYVVLMDDGNDWRLLDDVLELITTGSGLVFVDTPYPRVETAFRAAACRMETYSPPLQVYNPSLQVKFKRLHPDAVLPSYAKPGDAGLDLTAIDYGDYETKEEENLSRLYAHNESVVHTATYIAYRTGLAVEIPRGHVGLIFPRSSISNVSLSLCNAVGVIDSGYRGEIGFRFRVTNEKPILYKPGDKIGQLVILPIPHIEVIESSDLSDSERGEGGFGSSDRKGCTCAEWTGAKCAYCQKALGV